MSSAHNPERLDALIELLLDGSLDDAQRRELDALICADESAAQALVEAMDQHAMLQWEFGQVEHETFEAANERAMLNEMYEQALDLRRLHEIEDHAQAKLIADLNAQKKEADLARRRAALERKENDRPTKVIIIPKLAVVLGVAAIVGLVVWLGWPNTPQPAATPESTYAAMLSGTQEARWADGAAYQSGDKLQPGRLNLTHGQATLVFGNGTEVTLQAPAQFTILDDAAGKLHAGELSALVPVSGHGFEVMIPGGVVTDLGTAFQVQVWEDHNKPARVEVTRGEVTVAPMVGGRRGRAILLQQDQFADVRTDGSRIDAFARREQRIVLPVPDSGQGIGHGKIHPDWTVQTPGGTDGQAVFAIAPEQLDPESGSCDWLQGEAGDPLWLAFSQEPRNGDAGVYSFQTTLVVPDHIDLASVRLRVRYIADDTLQAVRVGGQLVLGPQERPIPWQDHTFPHQYRVWSEVEIDHGFVHGQNIVVFEIDNHDDSNPTGFCVELIFEGTSRYVPLPNIGASQPDQRDMSAGHS